MSKVCETIEIRNNHLGKSVYATQAFEKGQVILRDWGPRVPHRTQHSFQVDTDTHIVISSPIQLINHSCEPNCGVVVKRDRESLEIHALRRIEPGEELTTDYATFEYEVGYLTGPCLCGSPQCRGFVTGYKDLPSERRAAYGPYIAAYLRDLDDDFVAEGPLESEPELVLAGSDGGSSTVPEAISGRYTFAARLAVGLMFIGPLVFFGWLRFRVDADQAPLDARPVQRVNRAAGHLTGMDSKVHRARPAVRPLESTRMTTAKKTQRPSRRPEPTRDRPDVPPMGPSC